MQCERMENENYGHWLKASLSLYYVKRGITDFAQDGSLTLHNQLRQKVQHRLSSQGLSSSPPCTTCTSKSIKRTFDRRTNAVKWHINCATCSVWLEELLRQHRHWPSCAHVTWENTDPTLWPTHPWEVAKVYQPRGCKSHSCAEEADVAALLSFITDCKVLLQYIANTQNLHEVRSIRNSVMHSCSLEVTDTDMQAWTTTIIALLEDPKHFLGLTPCQEAVRKIKELQNNLLDVSLHKELEATALQQRREVTKQDLDGLESLIREVESEMDSKLNNLKDDVETVKSDVRQIKEDNEQITAHVHELDENQTVTISRLSILDNQVQENEEILQQCMKTVEDVKNTNTASTANKTLERALKKVDLCQTEINAEKARNEEHQKLLKKQSETLDAVFSKTEQHLERLTDLGQTLTNIKQNELRPDFHDAQEESPRGVRSQDIKYLQRTLLDIYNQHCQRIPICPLFQDDQERVDTIYVEPEIQVIDPIDNNKDTETGNDGKLSIYRKLFYSGDKECKNIYITGEAGMGKSAFCEKMVNVWCQAHSEERADAMVTDDEKIMATFPLLFYLSLKDASVEGSVQEMIESQLTKGANLENIIENTKCLLILDGLDEWDHTESRSTRFKNKGVPNRPLTTYSTVVTTSRPWKLESLRLQKNQIDKHVKIVGLCGKSSGELAKSVMGILSKTDQRNAEYDDFENALDEVNLKRFMSVPLILLQLLCLWWDEKPFGNSQCDIYSNMIDRHLKLAEQSKGMEYKLESDVSKTPKLPKCFKHNKACQKYKRTLNVLSRFAFYTLFSDNRSSAKVVDHSQSEVCDLSKDDIDICLVSGLLTQSKAEGTCTERRKCINFVHKTYQEFFAAMYIVTLSPSPDLNQVFKVCCSVDRILEISDVFMFVFGMNSQVGSLLLQRILKVVSDDDKLLNNRRICADQSLASTLIVKVQKLAMSILEECERNGQKKMQLQLEDLKVDHRNLAQISKHLHNMKTKNIKSLSMTTKHSHDKIGHSNIFEQISKSKTLEKLHLTDNGHYIEIEHVFHIISRSKQTLKTLRLEYVNLSKSSDKVQDIFKIVPLESVSLRFVYLTHKQIVKLLSFPSKRYGKNISEIDIEGLRCVNHGPWKECKQRIDLSKLKIKTLRLSDLDIESFQMEAEELENIELGNLRIPGSICSILTFLQEAEKLEEFHCSWCKEQSDVDQMVHTLPKLSKLKLVELSRTDIKDKPLRLSPSMKNLEFVELKDLCISYTELTHFVNSLPHTDQRISVRLDGLTIMNETRTGDFLQYIRESPRFALVTSGDCINFHTDA